MSVGASNEDNGNGKVTLAIIGIKLDTMLGEVRKLQTCIDSQGGKIQALEMGQQERRGQITDIRDDIKEHAERIGKTEDKVQQIEVRTGWWNGLNSVGAIIAALKAFLGGP